MTRSEIIQAEINQYESQIEFLSDDLNLMVGTGFETNFRVRLECSKTMLEILLAEQKRKENETLTCTWCKHEADRLVSTHCARCIRLTLRTDRFEQRGD